MLRDHSISTVFPMKTEISGLQYCEEKCIPTPTWQRILGRRMSRIVGYSLEITQPTEITPNMPDHEQGLFCQTEEIKYL